MSAEVIPVARAFVGEDDLAKLVVMLRAIVKRDRDDEGVSVDDLRFEWIDDEAGWVRTLQVWEAGDQFVAAFGAWHETADQLNRSYSQIDIHPDWREPVFVDEVIAAMNLAMLELIERPVENRLGCHSSRDWMRAGLERAGYAADRYFFRMSASLDRALPTPELPDGFRVRPFVPGEIEEWVAAFNGAFADYYDPPTTTVVEKRHRMEEAGYLPAADLVLVDPNDRIVGIGRNSSEPLDDGSSKGWVNSVALLPEFRGRGLGRALLLSSMAALKEAGFTRVHLSVDSDNQTGAQKLYTSVGFTLDRQIIVYMRQVDPA